MCNPLVSVIILTKNEEKNIGKCLSYLFNQTYKDFEVIVVDANSTDNTVKIAESYGVKIIKEEKSRGGYGYARNLGIKASNGDLICFLDADIFLKDPKTLEKAIKNMKKYRADILLGKVCFPNTIIGVYLSKAFGDKLTMEWGRYTAHNRFMLAKKEVLYEIGLYDESFVEGAEDLDLLYRMHLAGKRVVYDPEIRVFHNAGYTVQEWKKKAYRDGFTAAKFNMKYGINSRLVTSKVYPILASLYAGLFGIRKIGIKASLKLLWWNYILAKERQKGYLEGLKFSRGKKA